MSSSPLPEKGGTNTPEEAALKGAPPPPGPSLHDSDEAAAAASDRPSAPEDRAAVGTPAVGGEGGVGGVHHEGRAPGKPAALKPSHYDELVHPKEAQDSAALRGRDAKKHGHGKHHEA